MSAMIRLPALGVVMWLSAHSLTMAQTITTAVMTRVPVPASSVDNYIHTVADLDRSFKFYRDVIGLPVAREPSVPVANELVQWLTNTSEARMWSAQLQIPGTNVGLLLTEFSNTERRTLRPRSWDLGASTMVVTVRDLDTMLAAAMDFETPVVITGGMPVALGPDLRSVFISDPDGFYVEIMQVNPPPETDAPDTSNVVLARVAFNVEDTDAVSRFYREVLGFAVKPAGEFTVNPAVHRLIGVENGEFRTSFAQIPGSALEWEFIEFGSIDQLHYEGRPQDPGAPAMSVLVPDVQVATRALRAIGLPVVTTGGEPVMSDTGGAVFVRDPSGLLLKLIERR